MGQLTRCRPALLVAAACLATLADAADRPWQSMSTPSVTEVAAHFAAPPTEYGMTFYWGWDGPVTEEVIARDLDTFRALGVADGHARTRLRDAERVPLSGLVRAGAARRRARPPPRHARVAGGRGQVPERLRRAASSARSGPTCACRVWSSPSASTLAGGETLARELSPETVSAVAVDLGTEASQIVSTSREARCAGPRPPGTVGGAARPAPVPHLGQRARSTIRPAARTTRTRSATT